jgi:hypothetical protein
MLFAIWTENRATEEAEENSASSLRSISLHTVSRPNSIIMSSPAVRLDVVNDNNDRTDLKLEKLEADEALEDPQAEDARPAVFTSTFWEVCAVASLVCGQLTNVYPRNYCIDDRNLLMLNKFLFQL